MNPLPFGGGGIQGEQMDKEYYITLSNGQRVQLTQFHRDEFACTCKGLCVALGIILLAFGVCAAVMAVL